MKKIIKLYKSNGYDFEEEVPTCSYCDATAEDTEISETDYCSEFICGDISCWNEYMMNNVFTRMVECEEKEIEVCDGCHEEEDTSYDGMCMPCWEDLNEHLEEE